MTKVSFAAAHQSDFTHMAYGCFAKGAAKPAIILHACHQCEVVVWLDSDIIVKPSFSYKVVKNLLRVVKPGTLLTGVDFYSTIDIVRSNPRFLYSERFNNGAIIANCSTTLDILLQWHHYTTKANFKDDQASLQLMADDNSIFYSRIKYDFMVLGAHSAYMKHFPGPYRKHFPKRHPLANVITKIMQCPL